MIASVYECDYLNLVFDRFDVQASDGNCLHIEGLSDKVIEYRYRNNQKVFLEQEVFLRNMNI